MIIREFPTLTLSRIELKLKKLVSLLEINQVEVLISVRGLSTLLNRLITSLISTGSLTLIMLLKSISRS
jgi:hypothetical protein